MNESEYLSSLDIAERCGMSLGTVNQTLHRLGDAAICWTFIKGSSTQLSRPRVYGYKLKPGALAMLQRAHAQQPLTTNEHREKRQQQKHG